MNTREMLVRARNLLDDPSKWTSGPFYSTDDDGCAVDMPEATRFCAIGALHYVLYEQQVAPFTIELNAKQYLVDAAHREFGTGPIGVNDELGYEAVLKMYDMAIAALPVEEPEVSEPVEERVLVSV